MSPRPSTGASRKIDDRATQRIEPVRTHATYELVVDQLRRAIQLSRFLPGDKLPPERQLAQQLGVSRTTVRDAIRVLEREGLVESRRGAAGGIIVLKPVLSKAEIRRTIQERSDAIRDVFDFRLANECAAARLAAERRTDGDIAALDALVRVMASLTATPETRVDLDNIPRFQAADSAFHLGIAQAARNPHLLRATEDARAAMFLPVGAVFRRLEDNANAYHEALFAAIEEGNADGAETAMRAHLGESRRSLEDFLANLR